MREQPGRLVLLGHPLGHSLSPLIQNAALRAAGIPLIYELLDVPRSALDATVEELRRGAAAGNVTIPFKESFATYCDRVSDTARTVGAVNTFWTAVDGALVGDNTDVQGFEAAARLLLGERGAGSRLRVAVLGAGGAAAAVLQAMKGWGAGRITVYSRSMQRAESLVRRLGVAANVVAEPGEAVRDAQFVVNATPVGLHGNEMPFAPDRLPEGCVVMDLVYRLGETPLVRAARARGHQAADGLTMLVEQGSAAFERWFGFAPDREAMWNALPERR